MIELPALGLIVITALIDSINPSSLGILILIISVVLGTGKSTKRLLLFGSAYIFAVFVTHLAVGLGLVYLLGEIPVSVAWYTSLLVALLVIAVGLLEIKDYFWYGKGPSLRIPQRQIKKIQKMSGGNAAVTGALILGVFATLIKLPVTGAPYLALIAVLRIDFSFTALIFMMIYNLLFIMPLIAVLCIVAGGTKISSVKSWKQDNKAALRLLTGSLLVMLGWILLMVINRTINFT